ncbi:hypothetical protein Anapl_09552 [Anas platyrhynchos]|uniref:Uncharacterized protein n=1 Tax=Anas platyrhynchos TaxID=8839 RepID=R0KYJ0_ANAPL|nr:hypothetical protein Anapl_09552 [Anas platyrhynchos]
MALTETLFLGLVPHCPDSCALARWLLCDTHKLLDTRVPSWQHWLQSLLVTTQAGVVENMKKLIYHSQPEVTEASHSMLEGTEIAAFHKALGPSVVSLCSEYSLPSWSFCQQLRQKEVLETGEKTVSMNLHFQSASGEDSQMVLLPLLAGYMGLQRLIFGSSHAAITAAAPGLTITSRLCFKVKSSSNVHLANSSWELLHAHVYQ